MKYDYYEARKRIENILSNKLEGPDKQPVSFNNDALDMGYYKLYTAVYINISEASSVFCFTSELIELLREYDNLREIGLKNECIYAIFNTPSKSDVYEIMDMVIHINTYLRLISGTLAEYNYPSIKYGIGVATDNEFVIKAERRGVGLNNLVWQGDVLAKAQSLSTLAFRKGIRNIVLSISVYDKIIYELIKVRGEKVKNLFHLRDDEVNGSFYNTGIFKKYTVKPPEVPKVEPTSNESDLNNINNNVPVNNESDNSNNNIVNEVTTNKVEEISKVS